MKRPGLAVLLVATALAGPVAGASAQTEGSLFTEGERTQAGAVSTLTPEASQAAVKVLDRGGNALDAAVTATFVNGVARPEVCGLGGGGTLVYRPVGGATVALDFREQSPVDYTYTTGVTTAPFSTTGSGANVVGVPGLLAGMDAALTRYGTISLAQAVDPAHDFARDGVLVSPRQAVLFAQNAARLRLSTDGARVFLKSGGRPYTAGETLKQPDLAATLDLIGDLGPAEAFYDGPVSDAILDAMRGSSLIAGDAGSMSVEDLAGYRPFWRDPVQVSYRGSRVSSAPVPASGGLVVTEALGILEGLKPFPTDPLGADRFHDLAEAEKIAWADRAAYVGDPRYAAVPVSTLTSVAYADARRAEIAPGRAGAYAPTVTPVPSATQPEAGAALSGLNATVAVIDGEGGAAVITCSLEQPFGSAVVAPGTGVLLNSALTAFNAPGTGTRANRPAPRKRPRSSAAPVIVTVGATVVLAAGGSGGPSVPGGVLNTIVNTRDFGLDAARAVDAPRADPRGDCGGTGLQLCIENGRVPANALFGLALRGHNLFGLAEYASAPLVQAIGVDAASGQRVVAADRRGSSAVAVQETALPPLRITMTPRSVRAGRRATVRFTVRDGRGKAVKGAAVRFDGRRARTDGSGRASITGAFKGLAAGKVTATRTGYASGVARVTLKGG